MKWLPVLVLAAGCAGESASDGAAPTGGGVSFGGQQDIGQFRGILEAGDIPGPDTLDANGFFNEHYAPPPSTGCTRTVCLTPGVSVGRDWLTGAHQATLQVAVSTNVDPTAVTRKPLNLVVVVDHSGSMQSDGRLDKVKSGLHTLVDNLAVGDRLALVEFDDVVDVLEPFSTELDRPALHAAIDGLAPRGSTNIYGGLEQGFSLATEAFAADRQNRVIFLSDGLATAGDTSPQSIIAMSDSFIGRGIGLTTIGVGQDFDVALMRGLAEHGAGNFYFLEDAAAASEVFNQELDFFVEPLALDVQISAATGVGWQMDGAFGSTLWSENSTTGAMHIPAVFVASRTSQAPDPSTGGRRGGGSMIFIHLLPTGTNTPDGKVADLTLSYRLPGSEEVVTEKITLAYPSDPSVTPEDTYLSAPEMAKRYAMYNMFLGLRLATMASDPACAFTTLHAVRDSAVAWNATREDPDLAADISLIDLYLANLAAYGTTSSESTLLMCGAADPYHGESGYQYYGNDQVMACSAGHSPRGLAIIAIALAFSVRRRRRTL